MLEYLTLHRIVNHSKIPYCLLIEGSAPEVVPPAGRGAAARALLLTGPGGESPAIAFIA